MNLRYQPKVEHLETRLAPALAIYGVRSVPTPTASGPAIYAAPLAVQSTVVIDYGSASVGGSSDPDGDGI
jgi:hypothetical protein